MCRLDSSGTRIRKRPATKAGSCTLLSPGLQDLDAMKSYCKVLQPGAEVTRPGFCCEENQPHLSAPEI